MRACFKMSSQLPLVGIIPAAGLATRLQPLPFSKELYPVGLEQTGQSIGKPKVIASYLLDQFKNAGANQVYVILRKGKWDIPAYFGDGSQYGVSMAYLMMGLPYGAPFSVDQAYTFVKDKQVLFGFPDMLHAVPNAFAQLLIKQHETAADLVLGTFEVDNPEKWDVVETQPEGSITNIYPKPHTSASGTAWAFACWQPTFTAFMHTYLQTVAPNLNGQELSMGQVMQQAIKSGLTAQHVQFSKGACLDVGTPDNLRQAILQHT